jgi:phage terminase large subunit-like protein
VGDVAVTALDVRRLAAFDRGAGLQSTRTGWAGPLDLLCALDHRTVRTPALELVDQHFRWAESTPDARLMVFVAPQEGKSSAVTRAGSVFLLHRDPTRRVAIASYADRLARRWGRRVRNDITANSGGRGALDLGLRLAPDQRAADEWELTTGGGVYTAGIGGSLTGRPVDCLLIDDPVKDRKAADSDVARDDAWDWWEGTASSRLAPGAPVILVMCMTGDTPVLRPDGTETQLRDIRPDDAIATYERGALTTARVINWASQGPDAIFAIRMKSGRVVKANARHPFLTINSEGREEWVRTDALRPNDRVMCVGEPTETPPVPLMDATSLHAARAGACLTTTSTDGQPVTVPPRLPLKTAGRYVYVAGMESAQMSSTDSPLSREGGAQFVGEPRTRRTNLSTGPTSSASTTTTTPGRCAACSAMTATSSQEGPSPLNSSAPSPTTYKLGVDEIESVTPAGVEDVYDLQVEGTENFIANGLVSHNTRWHHDDLAGRLLAHPDGAQWRVLHIPAQADPDLVDPDPLGRAPGEFMRSARGRSLEQWQMRKATAGDEWVPLYQGAPAAPGGTVFDTEKLRYWTMSRDRTEIVCGPRSWQIRDLYRFVTVDTATSTKSSADFTVASCWGVAPDSSLALLDMRRDRVTEQHQIDLARPLVERWSPECTYIESSLRGTLLAREAVAEGWVLDDLIADKSKTLRAAPAARRVRLGMVWLPAEELGELLPVVVKELKEFPNGRHDDTVDNLAYAVLVAFQRFVPEGVGRDPVGRAPAPADPYAAALPGAGVDYSRQVW